jgi:hypothetical protein
VIVKRLVHEATLAWAVAEAAKPYLSAVERDAVFVAIGAGETFVAIRGLLRSVEIKRIPLEPDLLQQCRTWLRGYGGHDDERYLRRLIDEPPDPLPDRGPGHPYAPRAKTTQLAALSSPTTPRRQPGRYGLTRRGSRTGTSSRAG